MKENEKHSLHDNRMVVQKLLRKILITYWRTLVSVDVLQKNHKIIEVSKPSKMHRKKKANE